MIETIISILIFGTAGVLTTIVLIKGGIKMLGKKDKAKELEKAKKMIEEAAKLEAEQNQQKQQTPIIDTQAKTAAPAPEEMESIKESVKYYADNYRGIFNPADMPTINPLDAEIASLLFGILQELRAIKEEIKQD